MVGINENIPIHFLCPLSMDLKKDPVTLSTGITYDRYSIEKWFEQGNTYCPITSQQITHLHDHLIPNHTLRRIFQDWFVQQQHIPTPIISVTSVEVKEILSRFTVLTQHSDHLGCRSLVKKIMSLCIDSDCNAECFNTNGTTTLLSAAFHTFSSVCSSPCTAVELLLNDILAILVLMFPLSQTETSLLASQSSLSFILWVLIWGDLPEKRNAVLVLQQLLSSNEKHVAAVANMHGQVDVFLLQLIINPICDETTKASLIIISYLVISSERVALRLVDRRLISLLLEILFNPNKKLSEISLLILDGICEINLVRNKALNHALTLPLLVKKIFHVSAAVNGYAVSILCKLCDNLRGKEKEDVLMVVIQSGGYQKLEMLIQMDCTDSIKGKANKLRKLLIPYLNVAHQLPN